MSPNLSREWLHFAQVWYFLVFAVFVFLLWIGDAFAWWLAPHFSRWAALIGLVAYFGFKDWDRSTRRDTRPRT
jgi:hypothetical protein